MSSSNILAKMRTNYPLQNECEIRVKLLPGFCQLQLNFGEFELSSRYKQFCFEFLELDGVQYCADELKNSSRLINLTDLSSRSVLMRYSSNRASSLLGFRAIFKQLECNPEPLKPLGQTPEVANETGKQTRAGTRPLVAANEAASISQQEQISQRVEFKEIVLRSEFFELNSLKLSKLSDGYDPNMFVVYKVKKLSSNVCKLRLMFYKFNLEPSIGCKRDFLDINNVDRLCGELAKPEDTRRDYDWPGERDFLISFVSDSSLQSTGGFLLFGQQLSCPATATTSTSTMAPITSSSTVPPAQLQTTFDDDQPKQPDRREQSDSACHKLFYEQQFELSSPNWPQKYNARNSCHYLIHKAAQDTCSVSFNVVSLILGPQEFHSSCDTNTDDHLQIDGQVLCGFISRTRVINVQFGKRQFVTVKFSSLAANGFGFFIEVKQNKCSEPTDPPNQPTTTTTQQPTTVYEQSAVASGRSNNDQEPTGCNQLFTSEVSLIESEKFPHNYKHNQDCLYAFRRSNLSICALDIVMNHFELEEQSSSSGACENDYLEVDYSRFCGSYPLKHRLRFNYFNEELDKLIKFHSDASQSKSGFSLTVKQVSDCGSSPSQATPSSSADSNNSGEIINYLPDSSSSSNLSSVLINDQSAISKSNNSANEEPLREVSTLCQFVYHKERQYLMSPGYNEQRKSYDNNMDCLYKIVAKGYEFCSLKLTLVDIDLEPSSECHNDYLLIDNQRYCGSLQNKDEKQKQADLPVIEVQFADTLPREIHLLYHTNAHVNVGRGFKLFYEQQLCNQREEMQNFGLQNGDARISANSLPAAAAASTPSERQARRARFGQLSYPKNYVTSNGHSAAASKRNEDTQSMQLTASARDAAQRVRTATQTQPMNQLRDSWTQNRLMTTTPSSKQTRSSDEQQDDDELMLRKEIVVVKPSFAAIVAH